MSVYWSRTWMHSRKGSVQSTGAASYSRTYLVLADRGDNEASVGEHVPAAGSILAGDPFARASTAKFSSRDVAGGKTLWTVELDFARPDPAQGQRYPTGPYENPLLVPPVVDIEFADRQRYILKDLDDKPIQNTAGDLFGAEAFVEDTDTILVVERNELGFNAALAREWHNATNDAEFRGAAKDTLLLKLGPCRMQFHDTVGIYWHIAYRVHYNPQGWQLALRNVGYQQKYGGQKLKCVDGKNQPVTTPVDLRLNGEQASLTDEPVYLDFRVRNRIDFTLLGLPVV